MGLYHTARQITCVFYSYQVYLYTHNPLVMPGFFESLRKAQSQQNSSISARTIKNESDQYCVVNAQGETIIPYGYYLFISPFQHGLARVETGNRYMGLRIFDGSIPEDKEEYKWGIINSEGKEVIAPVYDFIVGFDLTKKTSTEAKLNGKKSMISLRGLSEEYDRFLESIVAKHHPYRHYDESIYEKQHYDEFGGIEGYSDEAIYDAFDGMPEAIGNID